MQKLLGRDEGFEELEYAVRAWAPDMAKLFSAAAHGLNALSGAALQPRPRVSRTFEAQGANTENLLAAFLSDLVSAAEQQQLGFDSFIVILGDGRVKVAMSGAPLQALARPVRAVRSGSIAIKQSKRGFETEIGFEV